METDQVMVPLPPVWLKVTGPYAAPAVPPGMDAGADVTVMTGQVIASVSGWSTKQPF